MWIVHFVAKEDLDQLCRIFAKPIEHRGRLDWVPPRWWFVMLETVRLEVPQWRDPHAGERRAT